MDPERLAMAQLVGFYVAAALTWAWIEVSCVITVLIELAKAVWYRHWPKEGFFSTISFAGLVWASYYLPDRALEFCYVAYLAAQQHAPLVYEPNIANVSRSTNMAALFWAFGSVWVGKVIPIDVPWLLASIVWLLVTAAAGLGAAVLYLAAS